MQGHAACNLMPVVAANRIGTEEVVPCEENGGQKIAEDYIPEGNMTVYAHWISHKQLRQEWLAGGNCWYLYSDGISTMICFELEGTLCYFSSMEPMCQNWMVWTDSTV